jgi:hypothetical protein
MISIVYGVSKSYNYLYHIYHIIYFIIISNKYICTIQIIYNYSSALVDVPTTVLKYSQENIRRFVRFTDGIF